MMIRYRLHKTEKLLPCVKCRVSSFHVFSFSRLSGTDELGMVVCVLDLCMRNEAHCN